MMPSSDINDRFLDLKGMKINEFRKYGTWLHRYVILRTPSGWIYSVRWLWKIDTFFVPLKG